MDWQDVAKTLSERFGYRDGIMTMPGLTIYLHNHEDVRTPPAPSARFGEIHLYRAPPCSDEFRHVALRYREGDDAPLTDYLRSDRPLGEAERWALSDLLKLPPKDVRSDHKGRVRFAALIARAFYQEVRDECARLGVSCRGQADLIRRRCVEVVVLMVEGVTATEVIDVMMRARGRRALDGGASVNLGPLNFDIITNLPRQK
jgi:hypothetical protein